MNQYTQEQTILYLARLARERQAAEQDNPQPDCPPAEKQPKRRAAWLSALARRLQRAPARQPERPTRRTV